MVIFFSGDKKNSFLGSKFQKLIKVSDFQNKLLKHYNLSFRCKRQILIVLLRNTWSKRKDCSFYEIFYLLLTYVKSWKLILCCWAKSSAFLKNLLHSSSERVLFNSYLPINIYKSCSFWQIHVSWLYVLNIRCFQVCTDTQCIYVIAILSP